jgi:hypothetical protein
MNLNITPEELMVYAGFVLLSVSAAVLTVDAEPSVVYGAVWTAVKTVVLAVLITAALLVAPVTLPSSGFEDSPTEGGDSE